MGQFKEMTHIGLGSPTFVPCCVARRNSYRLYWDRLTHLRPVLQAHVFSYGLTIIHAVRHWTIYQRAATYCTRSCAQRCKL